MSTTNQPPKTPSPPFTIESMLSYCWGLSTLLSHNDQQRNIGLLFKEQFFHHYKEITKDETDKIFIQNVLMTLSKSLRNMGFVRENHVRYIDSKNKSIQNTKKTFDEQSSFTSSSKQSWISKIIAFIGGTISISYALPKNLGAGKIGIQLNQTSIQISHNANLTSADISKIIQELNQSSKLIPNEIALMIMAGLGMTVAMVLFFKGYSKRYIKKKTDKITKEQNEYWKKTYKPDMAKILYDFYIDLKKLVSTYYNQYYTNLPQNDILNMTEVEIKKYINNTILPTDDINWEPFDYKSNN